MARKNSAAAKESLDKSLENYNPTSELQALTNNRTWRDFIEDDAFMLFPEKDDWRKRFMYTMLEWAEKEDSLEITDFALEMKMRRPLLYEWCDKFPDFKAAFDHVKLMIGSRRRKGALVRKFDKDVVFKDMHKYDPEWLDINKYHSDMKKEEDKQPHVFIVDGSKPRIVSKEEMITDRQGEI